MKTLKTIILFFLFLFIEGIKTQNLELDSNCQINDGSEGVCVTINKCKIIANKLRKKLIRSQDVVCNQIKRYVCCPIDTETDTEISSRSFSWDLIEHGPSSCGKPAISFGTAFHGEQVKRGAYPWNVALTKSSDAKFFCGGSLLSNKLVVTAAHCIESKGRLHFFRPRDIFVVLGAHDLEARQEPSRITASVKSIYVHHDWNPHIASFDADIAVIELEDEVSFNRYIQPICIAVPNTEAALKTEGIVAGFGKSEHRDVENIARVIPSPIHTYEFCVNSSDFESLVTHRTFCGGYANGTSVCVGDSGSGLVVKYNDVYYLRGIVSSSLHDPIVGCNIDKYSVFTDILAFYSWITTGKDESTLLRELHEEVRRLRLHGTTTQKSVTTARLRPQVTTPRMIKQVQASDTDEANQYEFPHQALLGRTSYNYFYDIEPRTSIEWVCDGSLISQYYVLTASRCLQHFSKPEYVKLGMSKRPQDDSEVKIYKVEDVLFPYRYNPKMPSYDEFIGLVKLNESVVFNEFICPISLPSEQLDVQRAIVSGFLYDQNESIVKFTLHKHTTEECKKYVFGSSEVSECYGLTADDKTKCSLKEGSSLQILNSDQSKCPYTQLGVLTYKPENCDNPKYKFINLYSFIEWIKETIGGDDELNKNSCNIHIKAPKIKDFNVPRSRTNKASDHEFPHQALIGYDNNNPIATFQHEMNWLCGGSLISPKFVLTAVKCLNFGHYGRPNFVKLGMINRYGKNDNEGIIYGIKSIHQHPGFNRESQANDIALLELNDTVKFDDFICSACLPTSVIDSTALISGYAQENYDRNKIEYVLKYTLNMNFDDECKKLLKSRLISPDSTNLLCYKHESEQIKKCGVTEGNPIQVLNSDQSKCPYTQIGIVAVRSYECENITYHSTNLYNYVDWIKEKVGGDEELNKISCKVRIK